jgi:hypothetical protein
MPVGAGHARENCGRYKYDESWSLTLAVRSKTCRQLPCNVQYENPNPGHTTQRMETTKMAATVGRHPYADIRYGVARVDIPELAA